MVTFENSFWKQLKCFENNGLNFIVINVAYELQKALENQDIISNISNKDFDEISRFLYNVWVRIDSKIPLDYVANNVAKYLKYNTIEELLKMDYFDDTWGS